MSSTMPKENVTDADILNFMFINADFFAAPLLNQEAFFEWVNQAQHKESLKQLSDDLKQVLEVNVPRDPKDGVMYTRIKYMEAIIGRPDPSAGIDEEHSSDQPCLLSGDVAPLAKFLKSNLQIYNVIKRHMENPAIVEWQFQRTVNYLNNPTVSHRCKYEVCKQFLERITTHSLPLERVIGEKRAEIERKKIQQQTAKNKIPGLNQKIGEIKEQLLDEKICVQKKLLLELTIKSLDGELFIQKFVEEDSKIQIETLGREIETLNEQLRPFKKYNYRLQEQQHRLQEQQPRPSLLGELNKDCLIYQKHLLTRLKSKNLGNFRLGFSYIGNASTDTDSLGNTMPTTITLNRDRIDYSNNKNNSDNDDDKRKLLAIINKYNKVQQLREKLFDPKVKLSLFRINNFSNEIRKPEVQALIKSHRDRAGIRFIKNVFMALSIPFTLGASLGIYYYHTGSVAFWRSRGRFLMDSLAKTVDDVPTNTSTKADHCQK